MNDKNKDKSKTGGKAIINTQPLKTISKRFELDSKKEDSKVKTK